MQGLDTEIEAATRSRGKQPPATVRTAVAGVGGYAGGELARLLLAHPRLAGAKPLFLGRVADNAAGNSVPLEQLHRSWRWARESCSRRFMPLVGAGARRGHGDCVSGAAARDLAPVGPGVAGAWGARDRPERGVAARRPGEPRGVQAARCGCGAGGEVAGGDCLWRAGAASRGDCRGAAGGQPRVLRYVDYSGAGPAAARELVDVEHGIVCDARAA